jgi:hypothetical protein
MTGAGTIVEKLGADYFQDPCSVHARLRAERPVSPVIITAAIAKALSALFDQPNSIQEDQVLFLFRP